MKKGKVNKKVIIVASVLLVIIVLISFIVVPIIYRKSIACYNLESDGGWSCSGGIPGCVVSLRVMCAFEGGDFETGIAIPPGKRYYKCLQEFSDAGKTCKNSSDCAGACEYSGEVPSTCVLNNDSTKYIKSYTCSTNLTGTCQNSAKEHEGEWKSLENGDLEVYIPVTASEIDDAIY